ncbi:MAG: transglutaminaseTgpA domain-containing protein [Myxococcota bacterium]
MTSRWSAVPLLVVTLLYGIVGPVPLALSIGLLILVAVLLRPAFTLSGGGQLVFGVAVFFVAVVAIASLFPQPAGALMTLRTPWRAAAGAALLSAALRLYLARPIAGEKATLGLGLVALTACGGTFRQDLYPPFVASFCIAAVVARRYADTGRAPLTGNYRRLTAAFLLVVVSSATVTSWAFTVPRLCEWARTRFRFRNWTATGFRDRLELGSLRGMLSSDQRVLRIRGDAATVEGSLLRGIVYTRYGAGRWSHEDTFATSDFPPLPVRPHEWQEMEIIDDEPKRYFLPSGASDISVSSGIARADKLGILAPIASEPATRIWYRPEGQSLPVQAPTRRDITLPYRIAEGLKPFALDYTKGATDRQTQLVNLSRELQRRHPYSLEVQWDSSFEPVLQFVRNGSGGHCEYFASAFALMARTLGIPARVVSGYRVVEYNPVGDYYLVRERDAHSWVEAFIEGRGWVTFDPTPPTEGVARAETGWLLGLFDLWGSKWLSFLEWLDRRTPQEMVTPPLVLIALAIALRLGRRRNRRGTRIADGPRESFVGLSRALARRGLKRAAAETPLQFAARLETGDEESGTSPAIRRDAAHWFRRYSALRYGGIGDADHLDRDAAALIRQL